MDIGWSLWIAGTLWVLVNRLLRMGPVQPESIRNFPGRVVGFPRVVSQERFAGITNRSWCTGVVILSRLVAATMLRFSLDRLVMMG